MAEKGNDFLTETDLGSRTRPDGTSFVNLINRGDINQQRIRSDLKDNETRQSFIITFTDESSAYANVTSPLPDDGSTQNLLHFETGTFMPYTPPADTNLIITRQYASVRSDCKVNMYVDGQLIDVFYYQGGDLLDNQVAELAEFTEVVSSLDGSHTINFEAEAMGDTDLYGTLFFRTLEIDVS